MAAAAEAARRGGGARGGHGRAERSGSASAPAEPRRAEQSRRARRWERAPSRQRAVRARVAPAPRSPAPTRTVARPAATCCVAPRASAYPRGRLRGFGRGPPGARVHGRSLPRTLRTVSLLRFAEPTPSSCARYRGGSKRVGGEACVGRRPGGAGRPGRERRRPSRARPDVGPGVGQPGRSPLGQVPLGPGVGGAIPAAASWGSAGTGRGEQTRSPKCLKFSFAHFAGLNFEL